MIPRGRSGRLAIPNDRPDGRIPGFHEKNADAPHMPADPAHLHIRLRIFFARDAQA